MNNNDDQAFAALSALLDLAAETCTQMPKSADPTYGELTSAIAVARLSALRLRAERSSVRRHRRSESR